MVNYIPFRSLLTMEISSETAVMKQLTQPIHNGNLVCLKWIINVYTDAHLITKDIKLLKWSQ